MILSVRHAGIVVSDLEESLQFYVELLGLTVVKRQEESSPYLDDILGIRGARVTTIKLAAKNGGQIELLDFHSPVVKRFKKREIWDIGLSHIAIEVDDVDDEYRRLFDAGVDFISEPKTSPDWFARVAFLLDPDGNDIELVQQILKC